MTKWYGNKFRTYANADPNAYIPIIVSNESFSGDYHRTYTCDTCHSILTRLIDSSGNNISFYCSKCNIYSYIEEDLKTKSKFKTKEGPIEEPAASLAPEPTLKRKKKEIKGGLAEIAKRASVNILSYKEGKG
jgi:hypothetical protein